MNTVSSSVPLNLDIKKLDKEIKSALALKITTIVLAIILAAFTAVAVLFFPSSAVIAISVITGVLLLGSISASIAQEVLLKKKRKVEEKNHQQELTKLERMKAVSKEFQLAIPTMTNLLEQMDKWKTS